MKRKNIFAMSLAALTATATLCSAQEVGQPRARATGGGGGGGGNQGVTIVADKDAPYEEVVKAIDQAKAAGVAAKEQGADAKPRVNRLAGVVQRGRTAGRALVIPKDAADAKILTEMEEDLNVMAHILAKASASEDKTTRAMGIYISNPFSAAAPQDLYIEGHGVLFFLNVNYPLLPPPAKEKEPAEKEKTSSEWEEARRELSGQPRVPGGGGVRYGSGELPFVPGTSQNYDADKVEDLKKDIIAALKNAAHIRKLKSDETVTVVVSGPSAEKGIRKVAANTTDPFGSEYQIAVNSLVLGNPLASSGPATKLIVRARKADADAFQNGKLTADEFRKKVTVMAY